MTMLRGVTSMLRTYKAEAIVRKVRPLAIPRQQRSLARAAIDHIGAVVVTTFIVGGNNVGV